MATDGSQTGSGSLLERAKALLLRPKEFWPAIEHDMTPSGELFTRYAAPLAAIGPVCGFIAGRAFGWAPFGTSFFGQLFTAAGTYCFSMVNLLAMSFIASKLAPRFGGTGSPRDAFKLIVYSSTAAWLAGAATLFPAFGILGLLSIYSLYLYFTGIGPLMKVPDANRKRFGIVTMACAIGLHSVTGMLSSAPAWLLGGSATEHRPQVQQQLAHDDGSDMSFDPGDFRDAMAKVKEALNQGDVEAVAPTDLEALLPGDIGGFERTRVESERHGPGGTMAEGRYEHDDQKFKLKITDLARFAALAQIGLAFRPEQNRRDAHGFEHVTTKDGRLIAEKWDNDDKDGSYTTILDKRFLVQAEGEADNLDQLKKAVDSIDLNKLDSLSKEP